GDGEALEHRRSRVAPAEHESKISDDPAVFKGVIQHYRIAEIVGVAEVAEVAIQEAVESERGHAHAVDLAKNSDRGIDGLDVVHRAYVAVGIRGMASAPVCKVQAVKVSAGAWRRIAGGRCACAWRGCRRGSGGCRSRKRYRRHLWLFKFRSFELFRRHLGQCSQIASEWLPSFQAVLTGMTHYLESWDLRHLWSAAISLRGSWNAAPFGDGRLDPHETALVRL